jgi:OOP family OmpA-OmpF porin
MKKLFWVLSLFICSSSALYSQFYLGASAGNAFINKDLEDVNGSDFNVDENSFAYKIFGGFGIKFLGVEGGYRDLGEVKNESGQTALKSSITGWDVAAKGKLHLGPIVAFVKAGAFFANYKNEVDTRSYSENSTNFLWGLGAGLEFGRLGIRAEFEGMGEENSSLSMLSLGATFQFGGRE